MGCILSRVRIAPLTVGTVEIKQNKRTVKQKIVSLFKKKPKTPVTPTDREHGVHDISVSLASVCSLDWPVEEESCISLGKPDSPLPFKTYSNISITEMINMMEETRAQNTASKLTYTVRKDREVMSLFEDLQSFATVSPQDTPSTVSPRASLSIVTSEDRRSTLSVESRSTVSLESHPI
jgi:hypothetical protein